MSESVVERRIDPDKAPGAPAISFGMSVPKPGRWQAVLRFVTRNRRGWETHWHNQVYTGWLVPSGEAMRIMSVGRDTVSVRRATKREPFWTPETRSSGVTID